MMKNSGESAEIIAEKWKKLSVFNSISTFHHPNQIEFESCWCSTLGNYDGDKWDKLDNFSFPSENTKSLKFLIELVQSLHMNFLLVVSPSLGSSFGRICILIHGNRLIYLTLPSIHSDFAITQITFMHISVICIYRQKWTRRTLQRRKEVGKVAKYRTRELSMCSLVVKYRGKKRISWLTKEFSCWSSEVLLFMIWFSLLHWTWKWFWVEFTRFSMIFLHF